MPKYDAFGREIGEDTLRGLGGSPSEPRPDRREEASGQPQPAQRQSAPADEAERRALADRLSNVLQQQAATRPATPTVTVRRSGGGRGCLIALVVLLVAGAAAALAIVGLVGSIDIEGGIEDAVNSPATSEPAPKGIEGESLARPEALGAALATIRSQGGGKLANLRVAPDRVDATLLTPQGRLRHVQVKPGGKLERFGSDSGPGFDGVPTTSFEKLRPGAVQRLARRGAEEHGIPVSEFQYAVPQDIGGQVRWVVYFTRGRYVIGDARGRFERALP